MTTWTDEQDAYLRQLRADGVVFEDCVDPINARFHTCYTRNALIGRAKRIRLSEQKRTVREKKQTTPGHTPKGYKSQAAQAFRAAPSKAEAIALKPVKKVGKPAPKLGPRGQVSQERDHRPLRCVEVEPLHLALLDLDIEQCRYPYGEGPFTFCGHRSLTGLPYCAAHQQLTSGGFGYSRKQAA